MGDRPLCKCIAYKEMNTINTTLCEIHGAPSPARDDAEKPRLTDAEKAEIIAHIEAGRTWQTLAYVESILAAHIGAPDELTAALASRNLARARQDEIADERDALRERIRALADEWAAFPNHDTLHLCARDLRRLLGDA